MELINKAGIWTACLSFIIGITLLLAFYLTNDDGILIASYCFLLVATLFNLILFFLLIFSAITLKENKARYLKTAGFMFLNVPIAIACFCFGIALLSNLRITFINETGQTISNLKLEGCESEHIKKLKPNESQTVWIRIPRDCSVNLQYSQDGINQSEEVWDYASGLMGQKGTYRIGTQKTAIDNSPGF